MTLRGRFAPVGDPASRLSISPRRWMASAANEAFLRQFVAARRQLGLAHLAGLWKFPGGKVEAGETDQEALSRELREELGIEVTVGDFLRSHQFDYDDKHIELIGNRVTLMSGDPQAQHHAEFR